MNVREWIESRQPPAPDTLTQQILVVLGDDADAAESLASEVCLQAAARALDALLCEGRFARESALRLLAIDALATYAFEHASETAANDVELERFAQRAAFLLGQDTTQRV